MTGTEPGGTIWKSHFNTRRVELETKGLHHIILEKGELTRRALNLLTTLSREEVSGTIRFLEDYR